MSGASGDEVLVRLAVGGDRAAFGALVTPHVTDLTRLCRRVAGPALADDCVQDTLLLALLRLQSLREPGLFEHWLRGIAIRVCHRTRARLGNPRPVSLSRSALEVLAIVAYRQPIARSGIEHIRGSSSDSALDTLLQRGLVVHNEHHLLVTTRARKTPRF
jgi:DNA-directed RNA polymerase specialized sigma24 family protein